MSGKPRILVFAGSTRRESYNKKLARLAAEAVRIAGGDATLIDLADYPLPLMDQDLETEKGPPENVAKLRGLMMGHQGMLIASPEYNSSITPLLKNAIDWTSRPANGTPSLAAFTGKVAALVSASPGALGGLRGLVTLRSILGNIGVLVLPDQIAIPVAHEAFTAEGALKDDKIVSRLTSLAGKLVQATGKLG